MTTRNVLITGANRGIGFGLSAAFAKRTETQVFAACRDPNNATELLRLAQQTGYNLEIVELDVGDELSIARSSAGIAERVDSLDILINNAGMYGGTVAAPLPESSRFGHLEMEAMLRIFRVNTVAPVLLAQAFAGLLERAVAPRIVNVSSDAGSIGLRENGGSYSYPASKAALNMMTRCLSAELRSKGIIVVSVHPGFLKTDMGGPNAPLTLDDTIPRLVDLVEGLSMKSTGTFLNWDGTPIAW